MNLFEEFSVVDGSVPGRHHRTQLHNSQDAVCVLKGGDFISAVVCDGCGSTPHAEVGAKLGALYWSRFAAMYGPGFDRAGALSQSAFIFDHASEHMSLFNAWLHGFLESFPGNPYLAQRASLINEMFLFTVLGVFIDRDVTTIYGAGDGVFSLNGLLTVLDENNQPRYLAYDRIRPYLNFDPGPIGMKVHARIPTPELKSVLIGTDGLTGLADRGAEFIEKDVYHGSNASLVEKRLRGRILHPEEGDNIHDDTTLVAIRRK